MIGKPFQWRFVIKWAIATGVSWLVTHPMLHRIALELSPLWAPVMVTLVATVTFVQALARKRRSLEPQWRSIPINTGWAIVAVISIALGRPGSIAGVLQWPFLRQYISRSPWWILMSSVGACIALVISGVVVGGNVYLYFALEGAALGLMQWLVLRRQLTSAGWWIVASTIGWLIGGLGTVAAGAVYNLLSNDLSDAAALVVAHTAPNMIGGVLCGVVTGVSLAMLLRKQKSPA
jgi:hypothetical protein